MNSKYTRKSRIQTWAVSLHVNMGQGWDVKGKKAKHKWPEASTDSTEFNGTRACNCTLDCGKPSLGVLTRKSQWTCCLLATCAWTGKHLYIIFCLFLGNDLTKGWVRLQVSGCTAFNCMSPSQRKRFGLEYQIAPFECAHPHTYSAVRSTLVQD